MRLLARILFLPMRRNFLKLVEGNFRGLALHLHILTQYGSDANKQVFDLWKSVGGNADDLKRSISIGMIFITDEENKMLKL